MTRSGHTCHDYDAADLEMCTYSLEGSRTGSFWFSLSLMSQKKLDTTHSILVSSRGAISLQNVQISTIKAFCLPSALVSTLFGYKRDR